MTSSPRVAVDAVIVDEETRFTLAELSRCCGVERETLVALVDDGALEPCDASADEWLFSGRSLARARLALRLARDLELDVPGTALVLDLLDEIEALRSRLRRAGLG